VGTKLRKTGKAERENWWESKREQQGRGERDAVVRENKDESESEV
jgi:hypothetical protein